MIRFKSWVYFSLAGGANSAAAAPPPVAASTPCKDAPPTQAEAPPSNSVTDKEVEDGMFFLGSINICLNMRATFLAFSPHILD